MAISSSSWGLFAAVRFRFQSAHSLARWLVHSDAHKGKNYYKLLTTREMNFSAKMTNVRQAAAAAVEVTSASDAFKITKYIFGFSEYTFIFHVRKCKCSKWAAKQATEISFTLLWHLFEQAKFEVRSQFDRLHRFIDNYAAVSIT